jgi:predicted metal-dependent hydrolase
MSLRALLFRRPPDPQLIEISFDGEVYPVQLRRHAQARRYTLRIQAATRTVLLTMPMRGSLREAKAFAERNGGWIAARLKRLPQAIAFADGLTLPLRDVPHRITHRPGRGTVWIETSDDMPLLCVAGECEHLARRVRDYLKREAKRELEAATRRYAAMLGVTVNRVAVRDQTSRWGSCTSDGVLSYSWRLILAPSHVLDYLAAHEVAHLVEMNHSRAFWRVVARICPEWERAKGWLNAHGTALHRFGGE